jgi:uracil-DNA glycosylase
MRSRTPCSTASKRCSHGDAVTDPTAVELFARLLRQRAELGAPPLFLEGLGRDEALALMAAAQGGDAGGAREVATTAPPPKSPRPVMEAPARRSQAPGAIAPGSGSLAAGLPLPVLPSDHAELKALVSGCMRCGLSGTRTQVVFNDGVPNARLVVVGEAPGQNEDETGLPFVGAAGKLLDLLLMSVDLSRRENVYICNVLKCRPPGNRNPLPDEIEACRPILERQIEVVAPEVILAVGTFAAQWLTGSQAPLGKLRGTVYSYRGVPLVVTYHPAAILRNQGWTRATWDDFQLLRQVLDRGA